MSADGKGQEAPRMTLPIEWHIPDSVQSRYASHVIVQAGQFEIVLTFFETRPPLLTGQPDENKAKLEQVGAVRAEGVARIIMPPEQVAALIPALKTGLDAYHALKGNMPSTSA